MAPVLAAIKELSNDDLEKFEKTGSMTVAGQVLDSNDVKLVREFVGDKNTFESAYDSTVLIVLNVKEDPQLLREGIMRAMINRVQRLRKAAGLSPIDKDILVYYNVVPSDTANGKLVSDVLKEFLDKVQSETNSTLTPLPAEGVTAGVLESASKVHEVRFELKLTRKTH